MVEIYMNKGFSRGDAETILNVMFNYRDFFIDHMMVEVGARVHWLWTVVLLLFFVYRHANSDEWSLL